MYFTSTPSYFSVFLHSQSCLPPPLLQRPELRIFFVLVNDDIMLKGLHRAGGPVWMLPLTTTTTTPSNVVYQPICLSAKQQIPLRRRGGRVGGEGGKKEGAWEMGTEGTRGQERMRA